MLTSLLSLNNKVVQTKGHVVSDMDGSKVMLSIEKGKYYSLGQVGGLIWDLMESPTKIQIIIGNLMDRYEVGEEACKEQVLAFIRQLIKEDLVVLCD
jgi:hypothetical protein